MKIPLSTLGIITVMIKITTCGQSLNSWLGSTATRICTIALTCDLIAIICHCTTLWLNFDI